MTNNQKRLRELRDRQSRERGRMAELSVVDGLNDEQRGELDTIERGARQRSRLRTKKRKRRLAPQPSRTPNSASASNFAARPCSQTSY